MANKQINQYVAASTIDAVNDQLLIDPGGTGAYNKINRNTLLGITSQPLGLTDTQSPTNKTFNNTTVLTIKDGNLTIQNSSDTTKQAIFSLSAITTATTRTYTLPNASDTLAGIAATQTLTNKTLTAPTISGGTIDNTTITVDSIAGHTSGTIVTVANLQISNGVLNSANAVTATSIAVGAVQPQALVTGTGSGWSPTTWTPSWTASSSNPVVNNGTITGKYIQVGKQVFYSIELVAGNTTSFGTGNYRFSLPVTPTANPAAALSPIGNGVFIRQGTAFVPVLMMLDAGTTSYAELWYSSAAATLTNVTPSAPQTWANTDTLSVRGWYWVP